MIAADTNVLVRLLVRDDPRQASAVDRLFDRLTESKEKCLVTDVVLCEMEWVLESAYGAKRIQIASAIEEFLAAPLFEFEERRIVETALEAYRGSRSDFSDCLIGAR